MKVSVVARHMDVTDATKQHVREKIDKLPKFYDALQSVAVTLDMDSGEHVVEIVATATRKSVFVAHHRGDDLISCLDQCVHKLTQQLRRHKDRVRDRHGPPHDKTMSLRPPSED